jgi:phosphoribosylanthranilate isomerase
MKVKICGLRTIDEALIALEAGADLLGFNFYPASPRFIRPLTCARLITRIRDRGLPGVFVGVFVNQSAAEIRVILDQCGLDLAQLSGDEPAETLEALGERAFKAFRPASLEDLEECERKYPRRSIAPAWLIDGNRRGAYGGTGKKADWKLARAIAQRSPILLAGGLNPENVSVAIREVRPWGVDVASGVECAPGEKDPQKVLDFIGAARQSEQEG